MNEAYFYKHFPRLSFLVNRITRANYEREMELLEVLCDRKRTGIDIGAKVGMYTYRIRKWSSDVIAFEPIPMFHDMLKAVFDGKRGRIEASAASNRRGTATLRMPFDHTGRRQFGRSTIEPKNPLTHEKVATTVELEVPMRPLDDLSIASVGFIKIDVEGHELAVLEGASETIARHHPNLLIECNEDHHPEAVTRLAAWMKERDYVVEFADGRALRTIADYDRELHWRQKNIENFICTPAARDDVRRAVAKKLAAW